MRDTINVCPSRFVQRAIWMQATAHFKGSSSEQYPQHTRTSSNEHLLSEVLSACSVWRNGARGCGPHDITVHVELKLVLRVSQGASSIARNAW